jgi:hypothetical protein
MADNNSLYVSKGYVALEGVPQVTSTKLDIKQMTNGADVDTILDEACGFSKGVTKYEVDIANPIPAAGFSFDWFAIAASGRVYTLDFVFLNPNDGTIAYQKTLRGVFRDPNAGLGGNAAATNAVTFHGREVIATGA